MENTKIRWLVQVQESELARVLQVFGDGTGWSITHHSDAGGYPPGWYLEAPQVFGPYPEHVQVRDAALNFLDMLFFVLRPLFGRLSLSVSAENVAPILLGTYVVRIGPDEKIDVHAYMSGHATGHGLGGG